MMERQAHPNVVRAKVQGEFPYDDDTSFFSQHTINKALDTEIEPEDFRYLGVDLAFGGEDRTVVYLNTGGKIRLVEEVPYMEDFMILARKIHETPWLMGPMSLGLTPGGPVREC